MKRSMIVFAFSLLLLAVGAASAQETMIAKSDKMMSDDKRPVVVFIRADWCPYCKDIDPKISKLTEQYGDKLRFVTLDITDKAATEKSSMIAKEAGLGDFFEKNKRKASTVVIFKDKKETFRLFYSTDEKKVAAAFENALKE